jgi:NADH-quinone oxidoreductase subunit M
VTELHFPWLEMAVLIPLVGAALVSRLNDPQLARKACLALAGLTFACTLGAWVDHAWPGQTPDHGPAAFAWPFGLQSYLAIDELGAPLLPLTALLYLLTSIATLRTKVRRFSFAWTLFSLAIVLATLSCREPWGIIGLLAAGTVPPYLELQARNKPTRVYVLHMGLFLGLLVLGWIFVELEGRRQTHTLWAVVPLLAAVLIRSGIVPFHCWITDLFEHATFGSALLYVTPMMGAYAAVRLVLPIAPEWVLQSIGIVR